MIPLGENFYALFRDGVLWKLETRDVPRLRKMVGDRLLVAFVRAFNAADRFETFMHMLMLNNDHLEQGSVPHARNQRTLSFLMHGTLYEAVDALNSLSVNGIKGVVGTDNRPWQRLDTMRKYWASRPLLPKVRHSLAHHLGDREDIEAGMDTFNVFDALSICENDGTGKRLENAYPIAITLLLAGLGCSMEDFRAFVERAFDDHNSFGEDVTLLFCDVLRLKGVRLLRVADEEVLAARVAAATDDAPLP